MVADSSRGQGAITLAVTPYLKTQGIPSRGRLYEIPKNIDYIIAKPRMALYIEKSKEVIAIYLDYVEQHDLHVYSVDEAFLDVTDYLKLYKKTDEELAQDILKRIYKQTVLTATCGIGPNLLLAKVAMDIEAKHNPSNIAKWTYSDVKTKLWDITPLSDMWGIGKQYEKRLNKLGIHKVGDIANYDKFKLIKEFGILGEELWNHSNGIDMSIIREGCPETQEKSISNSQILFKDYSIENTLLIVSEMIDTLLVRLNKMNKKTQLVSFGLGYSKQTAGGFYHSIQLHQPTNRKKEIYEVCTMFIDKYYDNHSPIRKISISLGKLTNLNYIQTSLFEDSDKAIEEKRQADALDSIRQKYGKNSILNASALLENSTIISRNKMIGGHNA